MLLPMNGNTPRWYELGLSKDGLIVSAHPAILTMFQRPHLRRARANAQHLEIPDFVPPSPTQPWGHGGALLPVATANKDWLAWEVRWAKVQKLHLPYEAWSISASLQFLFALLSCIDEDEAPKDPDKPQLMTVDGVAASRSIYGGAIEISIASALYPWIQSRPHNTYDEWVGQAMFQTYSTMVARRGHRVSLHEFKCWIRHPNNITLIVPGNACGLAPADWDDPQDSPTRMTPGNTDNPMQQLTLLAGMAAIHDLARNDGF
jgi:hypothetical protein